ncbi:Altered inheritance of mitochondria protein 18 mitochondrial [Oleoguttula sp. CCFEE 5521]
MQSLTRSTPRLLSRRLLTLRPQQFRCASRYSSPDARPSTLVAPTEPFTFRTPDASLATPHPEINPYDAAALRTAALEKRRYHLQRMRFAGIGLVLSLLMTAGVVWNVDLDQMGPVEGTGKKTGGLRADAPSGAGQTFQGKEVKVLGRGEGKKILAKVEGEEGEVELVETGTSSVPHFPRTIRIPAAAGEEQYTLLGLGIRTVSFLSIQVYVAGMYVRTADLSKLQAQLIHTVNPMASTLIPSEQESLRTALLDPTRSAELWQSILSASPEIHTAWRVVPTRNTDFAHLRDGWVTGIGKRTAEARQLAAAAPALPAGQVKAISQYEAEDFGLAMKGFMSLFAGGKAPKGSVMILSRKGNGVLDVWFQEKAPSGAPDESSVAKAGSKTEVKLLGSVGDDRISRLIWMNYLGGEKVSSEAARKGVAEGCVTFAGRPVGSGEGMVS